MNSTVNIQAAKYHSVRQDFPLLQQHMHAKPIAYLDNAATTQQPNIVIETTMQYMRTSHANVHRGMYELSMHATDAFESVRIKVQKFINAPYAHECIFVSGATEGINLVAFSYAMSKLQAGDEILITAMEHHANILPWQQVCARTGAVLKVVPVAANGEIIFAELQCLLSKRTKIVAVAHASNSLGTINPIRQIVDCAHQVGAVVLVDGAQACPHLDIDVVALGCDFYTFSAHKMYGPTGVGVLWGREDLLNAMPPYQCGGEMISYVTFTTAEYAPLPAKFEAGTPNIIGVIGFGAALDYLNTIDLPGLHTYEQELLTYATARLASLQNFTIIGTAQSKVPILSFVHKYIHAHDLSTILDQFGIAIRSGHHCAMPLMQSLQLVATARMSLAFYNTIAEIDRMLEALQYAESVFKL